TKHPPRLLTRREFWPTVAGMFSLVVGCSRQQSVTESPPESLSPPESRSITHALGTNRVPQMPQRIVALTGTSDLEALLVLDVKPFAAAGDDRRGFGQSVWQPHMEDQMQGVEMLPSRRNISLEKVATLQPDLIIGASAQIRAVYPQLSQVAPTVALDTNQIWQENLRLVAEVVGQPERAETWIMAFEQRLAALADNYREKLAGITYTTAYYQPGRRQFNMIAGSDLDQAFQKIGLTRPPEQTRMIGQQENSRRRANISLERLDLIDTDLLFFYSYDYPTIQKAHELPELNRFLEEEPLLRSLQAVENRRVFIVPAYYWFLGRAMGIPMAVDDLETAVLPLITQQSLS
ncbi:MAG: iron-siderophore ABC transporter substrate-binding protein, partial [Cyanobacteria bacterium J06559_3]